MFHSKDTYYNLTKANTMSSDFATSTMGALKCIYHFHFLNIWTRLHKLASSNFSVKESIACIKRTGENTGTSEGSSSKETNHFYIEGYARIDGNSSEPEFRWQKNRNFLSDSRIEKSLSISISSEKRK